MTEPIDESRIRRMIDHFYAQVRADPLLGPVFESRLQGRWPAHLDKMVDFWASALMRAGRYSGNPRATHAAIPDISPRHFERWLELFEETLAATFDDAAATQIHARAQAMARGLMRGIRNDRPGLPMTEALPGGS
jgi:hemoglobin